MAKLRVEVEVSEGLVTGVSVDGETDVEVVVVETDKYGRPLVSAESEISDRNQTMADEYEVRRERVRQIATRCANDMVSLFDRDELYHELTGAGVERADEIALDPDWVWSQFVLFLAAVVGGILTPPVGSVEDDFAEYLLATGEVVEL
jgi:hypothetical protein